MFSKLFRIIFLLPLFYWIYQIFFDTSQIDLAKSLTHQVGQITIYVIILNFIFGMLISFQKIPSHIKKEVFKQRRYLGIISFIFLCFHILFYFAYEAFEKKAVQQIFEKTYLQFALGGFIFIVILFLTSNDFSVKKLGFKYWKNLHRSIYLGFIFINLHVLLIEKINLIKYLIIFFVFWVLQSVRFFLFLNKKYRKKV